jgi:hypothetical protein
VSSRVPEDTSGIELWSSASWRKVAVSWLDEQLARAGLERTGDVEQHHLRAWATVLTAPTTQGPVWLKAAGPGTAFEVGLYQLLDRVAPGRVLTPIAIDVARGWIVLPDGGPCLADTEMDLVDALERILPQYGQLQLDLAPHVDDLLALGVADMRPAIMAARFGEALAAVGEYLDRAGTAADRAIYQRVVDLQDTLVEWCDRLVVAPGAPSLDHNDLHPWNILVTGSGETIQARFYDWGDSVVAHPFASMLIGLGFLKERLKARLDDPRILRVRDAYLEVFDELAPRADLVEALELACRVGKVARTLTWARAVTTSGADSDTAFQRAPLESLGSLLDDSYLGRV